MRIRNQALFGVTLVGVLVLTGCGGGGLEDDILGAWFAEGQNVPDGAVCAIFCPNNRMKLNDHKCDDVRKQEAVYQYTISGDTISYSFSKGTVNIKVGQITQSSASVTFVAASGSSFGPFSLIRMGGPESIYCAW